MPRGRVRIELPPKPCEADGCTTLFERRTNQTTTQFHRQRFCSPTCSAAHQDRPTRAAKDTCTKGLHPMTGDNVHVDARGIRRCKACIQARDAKRADRQPGARSTRPAKRKPAPVVAALPGARWRPDGWPDQPRTSYAGQAS
jgi:hypothetical protein